MKNLSPCSPCCLSIPAFLTAGGASAQREGQQGGGARDVGHGHVLLTVLLPTQRRAAGSENRASENRAPESRPQEIIAPSAIGPVIRKLLTSITTTSGRPRFRSR